MEIKTLQEYLNYIGIYGSKVVSQMKVANEQYVKYSFDELKRNALCIAAYLDREKHLRKGGMCAIYSENRCEWMMSFLGIVYNGIWAVPFDAKLSDREVKNLVTDCGVRIMFVSKACFENLSGEPELMSYFQEFIVFDPDEFTLKTYKNVKSFDQVLEEGRKYDLKTRLVEPDDVASLIYTSGTTGNPKGVMLMHKNFVHQLNSLKYAVPLNSEDTVLSLLPLHHTFQFSIELTVMGVGGALTYAESFKPNKMLANIRETNVTIMIGVPLLFEKLYEGIMRQIRSLPVPIRQIIMLLYNIVKLMNGPTNGQAGIKMFRFIRKKGSLDTLRFVISGAAPLNYKVAEGFAVLGIVLLNGYGLTESSPVIAVNRVEKKIRNESVGIPINGVRVKIYNPDMEGHGEVLATGDLVMKGYYKKLDATKEVIDSEGWLHTGDIGKIEVHDGDVYLYITGRSKNIIVTPGGKNVYPEEIEEFMNSDPGVMESLIIGIPESEHSKGENIYAFVVPNYEYFDSLSAIQGFKYTEEHITKHLDRHIREVNMNLKDYQKIKGYRIRTEEFSKTSTKKIKRYLYSGKDFLNT